MLDGQFYIQVSFALSPSRVQPSVPITSVVFSTMSAVAFSLSCGQLCESASSSKSAALSTER